MKRTLLSLTSLAAATTLSLSAQQVVKVDPAIAGYQKASGVSGNLTVACAGCVNAM